MGDPRRVGFVSTRLAGTDGVSLEASKWAHVLESAGFECFFMAGEVDHPAACSSVVPEAHFRHPEVAQIHDRCFNHGPRGRGVTRQVEELKSRLKDAVYDFVEGFRIGLLIPENALTIPMNIPLGLAITECVAETDMPTVAHHHDFYWERDRFTNSGAADYLHAAFPPDLPSMRHVVINSFAREQLGLRTGISSRIIPNVMDFDAPTPEPDDYASGVREALGVGPDELLVLQPTRVVARKGIEHAIELVHGLGRPAKLVVSHASGDEGHDYEVHLRELTRIMGVDTIFVSDLIGERRARLDDGRKVYTLDDVYPHADLVTYPSTFEGFGNAFLEAIFHRKPIVVNRYSIYARDIRPKGFDVIGKGIRIKGQLSAGEDLSVHGEVRGTVSLVSHHLTLESSSNVEAHLTVKEATFKGQLQGNSEASARVTVDSGAAVRGDIKTPVLVVEDGARFCGAIDMAVDIPADLLKDSDKNGGN